MRPLILPVIHYADDDQALRNAERAFEAGCDGVMLIDMARLNADLTTTGRAIRERWPNRIVGINTLGGDPLNEVLTNTGHGLGATWTDEQLTHSTDGEWEKARRIGAILTRDPHLMFCAVAFKHQPDEPDPAFAAVKAIEYGLIPTTSGPATGVEADPYLLDDIRFAIGDDAPLALASGVTPDNAPRYLPNLSHVLVSTGVSASFHEFDPARLKALVEARS